MYDKVIVACVLWVFLCFLHPCVCCQIIECLENISRKNDIKELVFIFQMFVRGKTIKMKKKAIVVTTQTR